MRRNSARHLAQLGGTDGETRRNRVGGVDVLRLVEIRETRVEVTEVLDALEDASSGGVHGVRGAGA